MRLTRKRRKRISQLMTPVSSPLEGQLASATRSQVGNARVKDAVYLLIRAHLHREMAIVRGGIRMNRMFGYRQWVQKT